MAEITPAGRRQRDRVALRATIDSVIVAARYWRGAPDDAERRRKFLQVVGQAESRSAALIEQQPEPEPCDGDCDCDCQPSQPCLCPERDCYCGPCPVCGENPQQPEDGAQ